MNRRKIDPDDAQNKDMAVCADAEVRGFLQGAPHPTTASRMGIDMASGAVSRQRRALHAGRVVDPLVHEGCSESRIRGRLE